MFAILAYSDSGSSCLHLEARVWHEFLKKGLEFTVSLFAQDTFGSDSSENMGSFRSNSCEVKLFELSDFRSLKFIKETSDTGVQDANLFFSRNRYVLLLFK